MFEQLTYETFAGRIGETFAVAVEGAPAQALVLEQVAAAHVEGWCPEPGPDGDRPPRRPFSLVFVGSPEVVMPQRIYRFEHDALGAFEIFIVPIGRDGHGTRYEAIFT